MLIMALAASACASGGENETPITPYPGNGDDDGGGAQEQRDARGSSDDATGNDARQLPGDDAAGDDASDDAAGDDAGDDAAGDDASDDASGDASDGGAVDSGADAPLDTGSGDGGVVCGGLPEWFAGTTAQHVKHNSEKYTCIVSGWCSQSTANAVAAYEPGRGWAWTQAWQDDGACQ
jgi:hypothetical protein